MLSSVNPSIAVISGFFLVNNLRTKHTKTNTAASITSEGVFTLIGLIKADVPMTNNVFNMLLPIRFPMAIFILFFLTAEIDVLISGREVPTAIIAIEIKVSLTLNVLAIITALFTTSSAPINITTIHIIIKRTSKNIFLISFNENTFVFSSCLFFL